MDSGEQCIRIEPFPATGTCGECGCRFDIDYWPVVNTKASPEAAERLRAAELFKYTCPRCGVEDLATYRNVYHDVDNKLLVLSEPPRKQDMETAIRVMDDMLTSGTYADFSMIDTGGGQLAVQGFTRHHARITTHPAVQAEKARIFWSGFDDRIMELVKILACGHLVDSHELFGTTLAVFWGASLNSKLIRLKIVGEEVYRYVSFEYYYKVGDVFADAMLPEQERYFIDRDWALGVLGLSPEKANTLARDAGLGGDAPNKRDSRRREKGFVKRLLQFS